MVSCSSDGGDKGKFLKVCVFVLCRVPPMIIHVD